MATIAAVAGAALGAYSARQQNQAARRASQNQGYVDTTTTRREDPRASGYLDAGAQAAYDALFGTQYGPRIQGDPNAVAAGATRAKPPAGMRYNAAGKLVRVKNPAAGAPASPAGPAAPAGRSFDGMSQETADIRNAMTTKLPAANERLYGAGEDYVTSSLGGQTTNPLLGKATSAADEIAADPRLSAYQDFLMGQLGIPTDGGSGGGAARPGSGMGGRYVSYGGSGSGPGNLPGTFATQTNASPTGADAALRKLIAGENPQGWDAAEAAISRKVNEGRADNIRQLRARAVGSGFYGGDLYKELETGAVAQGDQELADSLAAARYKAYSDALGLGTQYDLGMADIGSRERIAAQGANAAGGAAAADIQSRERLAQMGLLQDALGLGETSRFGRAGALGDLAGLVSGDQRSALAGVTDITGGRRSDYGAAGDLSLGADANRNNYIGNANQLRAAQIAGGNQRAELNFERERFYDPFARLGAYTDIMGSLYGGLGSETTSGRDTRSTSPPAYSSPWGAALQGAAIGGQVGAAYQPRNRTTSGTMGH